MLLHDELACRRPFGSARGGLGRAREVALAPIRLEPINRHGRRSVWSPVLAVRALEAEERALAPVAALLLVDEVQAPGVEGVQPLLPADLPQPLVVAAEVDPQHAEQVTVLGTLDRRRAAATLLRPLSDHFVMRRREAAAAALGLVVRRRHLLRILQRARGLFPGAQAPAVGPGAEVRIIRSVAPRRRDRLHEFPLAHDRAARDTDVAGLLAQLVDLRLAQLGLAHVRGVRSLIACFLAHGGELPSSPVERAGPSTC